MALYHLATAAEMIHLGAHIGAHLAANGVVCFFGDLGAGKTTFIKGIASALGIEETCVNSPTFQYLNIYQGTRPLFHFDLYRLKGHEDFLGMGFEEMFMQGGISCLEWSERIQPIIPKHAIIIQIAHTQAGGRTVEIQNI